MKAGKCYLILVIVTGILCISAFAGVELLSPEYMPALPDLSDSAGIVVMIPPSKLNIEGLSWGELHKKVFQKIKKAGIKMYSGPIRGSIMHFNMPISILRIDIDMLKLDDLQQCVFRIQASFACQVSLADEPERYMKADIWWGQPTMQVVSIEDMPVKVTEVVLQQVDNFIKSYFAVNPHGVLPSDADEASGVTLPKKSRSVVK